MRPAIATVVLAIVLPAQMLASASAQVFNGSDLHDNPGGIPGERILQKTIEIARGLNVDATIKETTKGNGTLTVGNLKLRVVDEHDDGAVYADGMPHVEFADIDGDGYRDLIVSGIAEYTDEKTRAIVDRESFVFVYRYDAAVKQFKQTYRHASFDLEQGPQYRPDAPAAASNQR